MMETRAPKPFELNVADELLRETRTKLVNSRFPDDLENAGWEDGTPTTEIRKLRDFWLNAYDWKTEEKKINAEMPQFKMGVPVAGWGEIEIHFVHKRSGRSDAIPLLFIHGCGHSYALLLLMDFQGRVTFWRRAKSFPS
jgi:hypothetical protein